MIKKMIRVCCNGAALMAAIVLLGACQHLPDMPDMPDFSRLWSSSTASPAQYEPLADAAAATAAPQPPAGMAVYCRVGKGSALFGKRWLDFADAEFHWPVNTRRNVSLRPKSGSGTMTFQAISDHENQRLVFCPFRRVPAGQEIPCASLYALDDDLDMGLKRTFDIPDALVGGAITCADSRSKLLPF